MIEFSYTTTFELAQIKSLSQWISEAIKNEAKKVGALHYIFCDDVYLLDLNIKHLNHDTLTDIISFEDNLGDIISGEIYISIERVRENAKKFKISFFNELCRVLIHGVLHFCGYKDKTKEEKHLMRAREDYYLSLRSESGIHLA